MIEGAAVAMYRPESNGWVVTWVSRSGLLGGTIGTFPTPQSAIEYRDAFQAGMRKRGQS